MERNYYDASSLARVLRVFEERYGMSSEEFYTSHVSDEPLEHVSGFHRHTWASFYRDVLRLRGDGFAEADPVVVAKDSHAGLARSDAAEHNRGHRER